jgi:Fe-S-cluster containining protein
MPDNKKRLVLLSEETQRREGYREDAAENPYWALEEAEPHPAPEKGCIRRGLCCKSSPGWFAPGEVEAAAAHLGMSPDAFVRAYVIIDAVELDGQRVEAFAPVKLGRDGQPLRPPGTRADRLYRMFRGQCVFYDGQGCRIYAARPIECQRYVCTNAPEQNLSHEEIARMWRDGVPEEL